MHERIESIEIDDVAELLQELGAETQLNSKMKDYEWREITYQFEESLSRELHLVSWQNISLPCISATETKRSVFAGT